jgi:2'-5' RNA ligase
MTRLFVAIDMPEAINRQLAGLCHGVRGAKWVAPEQFHLTLRFIGEVDGPTVGDIAEALGTFEAEAFSLALKGVGHFPPKRAPKVLWAGIEGDGALIRLHDKVESAIVRLGFEPESRNFAPHVTLARLRDAPIRRVSEFLAEHALFQTALFAVSEFHLYSSHLSSNGAIHSIEATYPLLGTGLQLGTGAKAGYEST